MVGSQAVQNVLAGERYKVVGKEIKAYCRGEYGRTPAPIDPAIQKKILGDTPLVKGRFADSLEPEFEKTKAEPVSYTHLVVQWVWMTRGSSGTASLMAADRS